MRKVANSGQVYRFFNQQWREFLRALTVREIKARYKHAVLGFLWVIINPLLQMIVMGFVFQFFVPSQVDNYFLFLFTGLLPWMFVNLTLTKATPAIVYERALVQKAAFPREVIVLAIVLSNVFHFVISLGLLLLLLVGDKVMEGYTFVGLALYLGRMIWLLGLLFWLIALITTLSLLTSALNVRFRDVNFIVQALVPLWFYATPIAYPLTTLPERYFPLFYLNPLTAIIEGFQWVLVKQPPAELELWSISVLMSLVVMYTGVLVFNREKNWFDDWF